ncbi:MAG: hypothetical protein K2M65_01070, partial [Muribaculaceae bacterium]|nr:hypothetical protein [Muribaculaceae bacterium]
MYTDGYCYDPASASWTRLDNSFPVMAGTTITRNGDILFLGGVEELLPTSPEHPGFSNLVRRYNIASNKIDTVSISPYPLAVTTTTVFTGDTLYITSGEERPGIRTPHILRGLINDR